MAPNSLRCMHARSVRTALRIRIRTGVAERLQYMYLKAIARNLIASSEDTLRVATPTITIYVPDRGHHLIMYCVHVTQPCVLAVTVLRPCSTRMQWSSF